MRAWLLLLAALLDGGHMMDQVNGDQKRRTEPLFLTLNRLKHCHILQLTSACKQYHSVNLLKLYSYTLRIKEGAEDRSQLYMTCVAPARPDKGPSQAISPAPGSEIGCHPSLSSDTGRERAKPAEVSDNDFHQSSFSQMSMP